MTSNINSRVSRRCLQGIALLVASGLLAGCSSDVTRFTDGIYTGSTPEQYAVANNPAEISQPMPSGAYGAGAVDSGELPPVAAAPQVQEAPQAQQPQQTQVAVITPHSVVSSVQAQVRSTLPQTSAGNAAAGVKTRDKATGKSYIVQSGDTISGIARKNGVNVGALKKANNLQEDKILLGQSLIIPDNAGTQVAATTTHPVAKPDTAKDVVIAANDTLIKDTAANVPSVKPDAAKVVEKRNDATPENAVVTAGETKPKVEDVAIVTPQATGIDHMRWPARGRVISSFGQRAGTTTNDGMDIMVPEGTSVRAAENGVVIYADNGLKEFGNTILIRHEDNVVTVYGHNSKLLVQRGQKVRRGDEIAKSGMSGNAKTPRLHFEVRKNSSPVNPVKYLEN